MFLDIALHNVLCVLKLNFPDAGGALVVSCDFYSLLQSSPSTALSLDGTTVAQLVYGKGMPAGGLYCPGSSPAGPCPVSHILLFLMLSSYPYRVA